MNTRNLTLTLAVAAAILTSIALRADEPFLSPRARDNQTRTVPGVTKDQIQGGLLSGSPKGREQFARVVSGVKTDPNLVTRSRNVAASPRALEQFPWLAQTGAPMIEGKALAAAPASK
jgi:hypothetical protein